MPGIEDLIGAGAGLLGGLFSKNSGNPNDFARGIASSYQNQAATFLDPNNSFYKNATSNYYNNLSKTLSSNNPGTSGYLAMMLSRGGGYGGSLNLANKAAQAQTTKSNDQASQSANSFEGNLYQQGLGAYESLNQDAVSMYNLYGQGQSQQSDNNNAFASNYLGLGGGLLARYFNKQNGQTNNGQSFNDPTRMWG
jgi:hypothetical protein